MNEANKEFKYKLGGPLESTDLSYVERQGDTDIYKELSNGNFCYVLSSSQSGKSSLARRIASKLEGKGSVAVIISMSLIGTPESLDQWYFSFITALSQVLTDKCHLSCDSRKFWQSNLDLAANLRFDTFIKEEVLEKIEEKNLFIFIDEINKFKTKNINYDDFFSYIKNCYDSRDNKPEYRRLNFILLGFSLPLELINSVENTVLNIGKRIDLLGFQKTDDLTPLYPGLNIKTSNPELIVKEILNWTGGQPFLTQKICDLISKSKENIISGKEAEYVKKIVQSEIINDWRRQDDPDHLKTIEAKIKGNSTSLLLKEDSTSQLLLEKIILRMNLYRDIVTGKQRKSNNSEVEIDLLLIGLINKDNNNNLLYIYNKIYESVFNELWIDDLSLEVLSGIRPYQKNFSEWKKTNKEKTYLLRGKGLEAAIKWSDGKSLPPEDKEFIEKSIKSKTERTSINTLIAFLLLIIAGITSTHIRFTFCSAEQYFVEKNQTHCFRSFITSGNLNPLLSSSNLALDQGIMYFRKAENSPKKEDKISNYKISYQLFENATQATPNNPIPKIFMNNAEARFKALQDGSSLKIFKVAVLAQIDYFEERSLALLRGIERAQTEFNGKNDTKLSLEIVIVNEGHEKGIARSVAKELIKEDKILGVVGHFTSEMAIATVCVYQNSQVPIIATASTTSILNTPSKDTSILKTPDEDCEIKENGKKYVFFRTIPSTKQAAKLYAKELAYLSKSLSINHDNLVILYDEDSDFSQQTLKDFEESLKNENIPNIDKIKRHCLKSVDLTCKDKKHDDINNKNY